jgi:N-methylhydantoinase A
MYKVGIDTGGTFTDLVLFDQEGNIRTFKAPTTPQDFSLGVMSCLEGAAGELGMDFRRFLEQVDIIAHGTTVATNVVLTGSGAKVGLITTKGCRDILEIRRGQRPGLWTRKMEPIRPLVPRYLRLEVDERCRYNGEIVTPLNEEDVRNALWKFKEEEVEVIAVCLLFSFVNPTHERRIREIITVEYPGVYVALSSDVLPQVREYERTSTTVLDAYVAPTITKYITKLYERLKEKGFAGELLIMQSNGGVQKWDTAINHPVGSINSGPAAAFPSSLYFADVLKTDDVISMDMGGTSFDVGLIKDRAIKTTTESEISNQKVSLPMVDILNIGAGGGSIAWVSSSDILRVGPQSAGALPGPACYGRGGAEPTVTDANIVLGYLDPDYFLGGRMKIDADAAHKAVEKLATRLGIGVVETASAIYSIVNENMINGIILASVRRGCDPRGFFLIVGGGAGATHAVSLAQRLGISRIIVPKHGAVYCAFGLVLSDLKHDYVRSYIARLKQADFAEINQFYAEMEREGGAALKGEGISGDKVAIVKSAAMRYFGQFKEIEIDVPGKSLSSKDIPVFEELFSKKHEQLFGYSDPTRELEVLTLKSVSIGRVPRPYLKPVESKGARQALKGKRQVFFVESKDFIETLVYDGDALQPGSIVEGPAVVEEVAMTLAIPPKFRFSVDLFGNYISVA